MTPVEEDCMLEVVIIVRSECFTLIIIFRGRGIIFTLSVCLSVCVAVCPANILVFYYSAIRRDIDRKFIQDTNRVVLKYILVNLVNSQVKGKGHRDGTS